MIKRILDILYPRRCVLCLSTDTPLSHTDIDLCPGCRSELQLVEHSCYQCGIPLQNTLAGQLCGQCLQKPPAYDQVISIYHYRQPLVWLIAQMKFNKKRLIARLLSRLMTEHLLTIRKTRQFPLPDAIIPVPLHHKRQYQRQFNQSEELAKTLSDALDTPLDTQYLQRHINSAQQSGLDAKQRKKNVKGIFKVINKKQQHYRHVVIIDDVMSTGSTVNEIARILKRSGIKQVDVWVLARAGRP